MIILILPLSDAFALSSSGSTSANHDPVPSDVAFNSDGTKMFVLEPWTLKHVHEYSLSSAYDVTTATDSGNSFSISGEFGTSNARGLSFNSDGTKMFVSGLTTRIYEYPLSSAFDITTAGSPSYGSFSANSFGFTFNSDGTKIFTVTGTTVYEYPLSSAFDITTAGSSTTFSVSSQTSSLSDIYFKSDGTRMFVSSANDDSIFSYSLSSAWDISTASYSDSISLDDSGISVFGSVFKSDGTRFYIADNGNDKIYQYDLSSAWTFPDVTAPTVSSAATASTTSIELTMSESVSDSSATASDFTISGVASNPTVSSISVSGTTVTLNLSAVIAEGETILVSYTKTSGSIIDGSSNALANFSNQSVTNNEGVAPTVSSAATASTTSIELTMSESVSDSSATASDFTISGVASNPTVSSISVSGTTVTLNLSSAMEPSETILVSYTKTSGSIIDGASFALANFSNQSVTNNLVAPPGGGGGCADCEPPTMGVNKDFKRLVDGGFSYNGKVTDVESFYTPFDLLTVEIGRENVAELKIYENSGPDSIQHIGLSFGLDRGQIFGEGLSIIEWDKVFGEEPKVTVTDPENILGDVRVVVDPNLVKCMDDSATAECMKFRIYHTFREGPDFRIFSTYIWDEDRNGWQNYFNHGLNVVGESLNPPDVHTVFDRQGYLYTITVTGDRTAVDGNGDNWYLDDDEFWKKEFFVERPLVGDTPLAGYDRDHPYFTAYQNGQVLLAENTIKAILGVDSIQAVLPDYVASEISSESERIDKEMTNKMKLEELKAFEKMYAEYYGQNPYGKEFPFTEPEIPDSMGGTIVTTTDDSQELFPIIGLMVGVIAISVGVGFYSTRKR